MFNRKLKERIAKLERRLGDIADPESYLASYDITMRDLLNDFKQRNKIHCEVRKWKPIKTDE